MTIYEYKCSTDSNVRLLVPKREIPEAAKNLCKGEWKYFGQMEGELKATDVRVALDSKKAVEDIEKQGFHLAKFQINVTETVVPRPPKK